MTHAHNEIQVATAGEALIDLVPQAGGALLPCLGGAVYNLTRAIARQGVGVSYLNALSGDRFGRALRGEMQADGAHCAVPQPVAEPTSLAVVALGPEGKADYSFYREGVADRVGTAADLLAATQALPGLRLACTGCLALAPDDQLRYQPWLRAARSAGLGVVVDANLRPGVMRDLAAYRRSVREALALADLVKASDDDLEVLLGERGEPVAAARGLFQGSPASWVALTLGKEGAMLLCRDGRAWSARERLPVQVVDTVGAGDCFLAGLLTAFLDLPGAAVAGPARVDDTAAQRILARAVASASLCVEQRGAVPPTLAQVLARVAAGRIEARAA